MEWFAYCSSNLVNNAYRVAQFRDVPLTPEVPKGHTPINCVLHIQYNEAFVRNPLQGGTPQGFILRNTYPVLRIWQMERMVVLGTTYYVDTELAMLVMLVHRDPEDEVDPIRALSGDSKHYAVRVAVAFDELPEIHRSSQQTPVPQQSE